MAPHKIMIIRHGEKPPPEGGPPYGVDQHGERDRNGLTVRGWQRAGALVPFFSPRDGHVPHPALARPTAIFAIRPSDAAPSRRCRQTVKPLGAVLGIARDLRFSKGQERDLAEAVLAGDGVALVCWEHRNIGLVVGALTRGRVTPPVWRSDRFDVVLVLDPAPDGGWTLTQVPELLLDGDLDEPLPPEG